MRLQDYIRDVPDFPKRGILFKDITPLLKNPDAFNDAILQIVEWWEHRIDAVAILESRGFIFGSPIAFLVEVPLVPMRKKGKLPWQTHSVTYDLEYGTDTLEAHVDAFERGQRVLVVDDLLATGGTAKAACSLVEKAGAVVAGCAFLIEIGGLGGRDKLAGYEIQALMSDKEDAA